jgi:hypothetical protein
MPEGQTKFNEKMRRIRWRMSKESFRFGDEIKLIPRWLVVLVIVLYAVGMVIMELGIVLGGKPFPEESLAVNTLGMAGIATAVSFVVACLLFLFGYVNRDAKRRGMNSTLWTLLVIFVPYLIGLIVYFLLREPLPFKCPQCGETVSAHFNFCPSCKFNLRPNCPQCKQEVRSEDRYCPHCGYELAREQQA